jgi:CubicO group peptidase (beta-lactamase class C family)
VIFRRLLEFSSFFCGIVFGVWLIIRFGGILKAAGKWSRPRRSVTASGLMSTADDLLAFAQMLLRGGTPVLPPGTVQR